MIVAPELMAVTRPPVAALPTEAVAGTDEVHVATEVRSCVDPSE